LPFQVGEEGVGPLQSRVLLGVVVRNLKPLFPFFARHLDRQINRLSDVVDVERVDLQDAAKSTVAARELREDNG